MVLGSGVVKPTFIVLTMDPRVSDYLVPGAGETRNV